MDHRYGGEQHVGELEVVEADQRDWAHGATQGAEGAAASARAAVSARTPSSPFTTRETVTPAMPATSRMVVLATSGPASSSP
jgi:hypothetical protein